MASSKTSFICSNCAYEQPKWLGRCPSCGAWNTFQEEIASGKKKGTSHKSTEKEPIKLSEIEVSESFRIPTYVTELDRVLGGGIVRGSAILVGGSPGIGKSTLMLQVLSLLRHESVLYVSGEESAAQIKNRASRLAVQGKHITVLCETNLERIQKVIAKTKPDILVVDSIQTLLSEDIGPVPGTVNQVKYACLELVEWAKQNSSAVFLVGHVTKEGALAGPKVIEHMVDTVLTFEQGLSGLRMIRAVKNRFGSVDELGLFTMEAQGLKAVADPGSLFLVHRSGTLPPGITSAAVFEGTRSYLVEIQALTVSSQGSYSRIYSDTIDSARVSRIAAVMEKHLGIPFSGRDIYIHVAGGIRLQEVGIELPLALALYSAHSDTPLSPALASFGEVSLAGEIRPTAGLDRRMKAAYDMGFTTILGPRHESSQKGYIGCASLQEALRNAYVC